ncbi:MAG TPA: Dam family site-specific DNA-(adenine-N6)-methyltransferase [Blastocatellia bacterium]|nr:Dam family site-specific DNA-(adenine-N6)-methyltransferase [Blastocatellia bacterium]
MSDLPLKIALAKVPPIKCQGIKTKLVPFILSGIKWKSDGGRWIEPFLGSGVVAFNLAPPKALLADTNNHIIRFYKSIQSGDITREKVGRYLAKEGKKLSERGEYHYYELRKRFNTGGSPLDFIFLNRSCFNGVMRFNRRGEFNVPFCKKPNRFTQSYITKIVNQIAWVTQQMRDKQWEFIVADWRDILAEAKPDDFVYLDPPYIGRHTDYYNWWSEDQAIELAEQARQLPCGFALSMWLENRYRKNGHIEKYWNGLEIKVSRHFYHVGSTESLRNAIDEALVIKSM